jgi:outer membrane receptor for ferrienterochelin and colicins
MVIAVLMILSVQVLSQKTTIRVVDSQTGEPCIYTNVVLSTLGGHYLDAGATNDKGIVEFELDQRANLCVTYVGYCTYRDTIGPGESMTVKLETDMISMEAVVVTGQYEPKPVDKSIYRIDVVDSRTLQERGVNNLAEALSNETSIRLSVDPSTGTSIELQGMGGENIKYLVDGVPLVGRVSGDIDLEQINMENVDHIEIVQGPMSVQYGTSAIAGVINIITKKNDYFRNIVRGNAYMDTKGTYNFGLYGSVIRGKHTFAFSGNRNLFQGVDIDLNVDTADADGHNRYMEFKPKQVYNADAEYGFRKNNFQLRVKSQYMNSLLKNYGNANEIVALAYDNDYHTIRSTNSLIISDKITDHLSYNITGAYTWFGRTTDHITSDLHELTHEITHYTSTVFNNIMTRGSFTWVPPGEKHPYMNKFSFLSGWDMTYENGHGDKLEEDASIGDYAVFMSGQYEPFRKLSLQPGIRFIYNSIYGAPVIPSFNLQWKIANPLGFRISYARGFRAPSLKELYLDFKDSNHDLSGNKELKAETTNSYNASFEYIQSLGRSCLKVEPSFFYNDGKDAITLIVTDAESNSATNVNLGGRRTLGGELNATYRHPAGLSVGIGTSRIGETYAYDSAGTYLPLVWYSNYAVNAKYSFMKFKAVLMANFKYYGRTPSLAVVPDTPEAIADPEVNPGDYYRVFTDSYGDLEVTFTKSLWKQRINIVVGARNLLNNYTRRTYGYRDYGDSDYQYEYFGSLNYGRTYFVKINLKFIQ